MFEFQYRVMMQICLDRCMHSKCLCYHFYEQDAQLYRSDQSNSVDVLLDIERSANMSSISILLYTRDAAERDGCDMVYSDLCTGVSLAICC